MNHPSPEELLDFALGERAADDHVSGCSECAEEIGRLRSVQEQLKKYYRQPSPSARRVEEKILGNILPEGERRPKKNWRKIMIPIAAGVLVAAVGGYFGYRTTQEESIESRIAAVRKADASDAEASLRALDTLREGLQKQDHAEGRQVYFERLKQLFLARLGPLIEEELARRTQAGGMTLEDLERLQALYLSYRMLCGLDPMEAETVGRVLRASLWIAATRPMKEDLHPMAERQLDFYLTAKDAPKLPRPADTFLAKVEDFLKNGLWVPAAYDEVVRFAEKELKSRYPEVGANILDFSSGADWWSFRNAVPGFFTQDAFDGYAYPQFREISKRLSANYSKIGVEASAEKILDQLLARYVTDYRRSWDRFLEGVELAAFRNVEEARDRLAILTDRLSPLAEILVQTWKRRTLVIDGKAVIANEMELIWLDPALMALRDELWKTLDAFAKGTREGSRFRTYALTDDFRVRIGLRTAFDATSQRMEIHVRQNVQTARVDPILKIVLAPIQRSAEALRTEAREEMNRHWGETALRHYRETLGGKYPLVRDPRLPDVTITDFNDFFRPDTGLFAKADFLVRILNEVQILGTPLVPLTEEYVKAREKAREFQAVLYRSVRRDTVVVKVTVKSSSPQAYTQVVFRCGDSVRDMKGLPGYTWRDAFWSGGDKVSLTLHALGQPDKSLYEDLPGKSWGLFRLCDPRAGAVDFKALPDGKSYEVTWTFLPGKVLTYTFTFDGTDNPFSPDFFPRFACPEKVAAE